MPDLVFDTLRKAAFGGHEFPVTEITVTGGLRDHVHEYPHSPGGAPEKLGRKLYEFKFKAIFSQGLKGYPDLYPDTLLFLQLIFDSGQTANLVVPTVGEINAYCTSWVRTANPKSNRKGEEVDLTFREDQSNEFLVDQLVTKTVANYKQAVSVLYAAMQDQRSRAAQASAILDAPDALMLATIPSDEWAALNEILGVASEVTAAIATAVGFGAAIVELALGLAALCEQVDQTSTYLQDPTAFELLYALHGVWRAALDVADQAKQSNVRRIEYVVPATMAIGQVSTAIYGDASQAMTLLQGNPIANPFAVPKGTIVKAYVFDDATA